MEFDLNTFTNRLRELMYPLFPYESDYMKLKKHKKTPKHIRDVAFMENPITFNTNQNIFEIGSENAERDYPYYHILENAPVIRKKGKGTDKTKGSQARVEKSKRDYEQVKISVSGNKWTYTKEYQKNVRGSRNRNASVSHHYRDYNGDDIFVNRQANAYENIHYQYIEKMLNNVVLDQIALEFGLKRMRTVDAGLEEEYTLQTGQTSKDIEETISSMLNSFM